MPTAETFPCATADTSDDAHDIKARGFWCRGQDAYFDVSVYILGSVVLVRACNFSFSFLVLVT